MISVVVCTYEQPVSLAWLLESLARQTAHEPFEVIIADDGSDAEVLSVVKEASWRYHLDLRYVWQPDGGFRLCRSRNNGIRCAKGRLLIFLDGDMVVRPSFVQAHIQAHASGEKLLFCGTREQLTLRADRPPASLEDIFVLAEQTALIHPLETEYPQQDAWAGSRSPWMAICGSNFSVANSPAITFNELFSGWGSEDREFAGRLQQQGYQILVNDTARGIHIDLTEPKQINRQTDENREHRELVELIRNKLLLRRLLPSIDTTPALRMLQNCSIDPANGHWSYDPERPAIDLQAAVDSAERWMDEKGVVFRPRA